jgi:3'(2'), 5'-bisphosphate nucleotidase
VSSPLDKADKEARTLAHLLEIARRAAAIVLEVYATDFDVEYKAQDDPVTRADKAANAYLTAALAEAWPGVPIVAEESDPASFAGFAAAPAVFFVDPLDGTREFVQRNGEFAVMIGWAEAGLATLGVIVFPALNRAFVGGARTGAYEVAPDGSRRKIRASGCTNLADARLVVSRSHRSPELDRAVRALGVRETRQVGSAGVKAAMVACGEADLFAHPTRAGKLWDACAPDALVTAAGGRYRDAHGTPIPYAADQELGLERGVLAAAPAIFDEALARLGLGPGSPA